jgi:uncharacterized membrane protein
MVDEERWYNTMAETLYILSMYLLFRNVMEDDLFADRASARTENRTASMLIRVALGRCN